MLKLTLMGIVETDETYIGAKPRGHKNKKQFAVENKRGRGTKKTAIIGAVQRGGRVVAQIATELTGEYLGNFTRKHVEAAETELITANCIKKDTCYCELFVFVRN
ncbi:hypothetical protein C6501_01425 [Candidatus Poribacteria bacterium]|nr:MAG: hypothetical protein C6501_01425 [Candidatus Poribacteria bacterium]